MAKPIIQASGRFFEPKYSGLAVFISKVNLMLAKSLPHSHSTQGKKCSGAWRYMYFNMCIYMSFSLGHFVLWNEGIWTQTFIPQVPPNISRNVWGGNGVELVSPFFPLPATHPPCLLPESLLALSSCFCGIFSLSYVWPPVNISTLHLHWIKHLIQSIYHDFFKTLLTKVSGCRTLSLQIWK